MGKTREIADKIGNIAGSYQDGNIDIIGVTVSGTPVIDETQHWIGPIDNFGLDDKADKSDTYTKLEVDTAISEATPTFETILEKPSTISGYGITDAYTRDQVNTAISLATPTFETILEKPNTISGYGITDAYTKSETNQAISNLVDSAPETLDTLNELAAALGDDANFSTTVATNIGNVSSNVNTHIANTSNPHGTTATQVGLGNVTNESKATMFSSPTFTGTVSGITSTMVGLGNVENKSSSTIRSEITNSNVTTALGYTPQNSSTAITTSNIDSQSVNYATSAGYATNATNAGNADTLDGYHAASFLTSVPAATSSTLGGIKVSLSGTTLTITTS